MTQVLRADVDKVPLGGMAMLPIDGIARRIGEAFQLTDRLGQHGGVVGLVDDPVAPLVFLQQRRSQAVIAEPATAFPTDRLSDTTLVLAINDLLEPGDDVRVAMLTNSTMIQRRPILCATAPVVPEPAKESRTQSPVCEPSSKIRFKSSSGLGVAKGSASLKALTSCAAILFSPTSE